MARHLLGKPLKQLNLSSGPSFRQAKDLNKAGGNTQLASGVDESRSLISTRGQGLLPLTSHPGETLRTSASVSGWDGASQGTEARTRETRSDARAAGGGSVMASSPCDLSSGRRASAVLRYSAKLGPGDCRAPVTVPFPAPRDRVHPVADREEPAGPRGPGAASVVPAGP